MIYHYTNVLSTKIIYRFSWYHAALRPLFEVVFEVVLIEKPCIMWTFFLFSQRLTSRKSSDVIESDWVATDCLSVTVMRRYFLTTTYFDSFLPILCRNKSFPFNYLYSRAYHISKYVNIRSFRSPPEASSRQTAVLSPVLSHEKRKNRACVAEKPLRPL